MVRVLLFAGLRHLAQTSTIDFPWTPELTISEIRSRMKQSYPTIEKLLAQSRVAVGDQMAEETTLIPDGAEIAFLPPVSGGAIPPGA